MSSEWTETSFGKKRQKAKDIGFIQREIFSIESTSSKNNALISALVASCWATEI